MRSHRTCFLFCNGIWWMQQGLIFLFRVLGLARVVSCTETTPWLPPNPSMPVIIYATLRRLPSFVFLLGSLEETIVVSNRQVIRSLGSWTCFHETGSLPWSPRWEIRGPLEVRPTILSRYTVHAITTLPANVGAPSTIRKNVLCF